ncbi:DNA polymerase III, beta subunit [Candidatus Glomeribacter gigasporarum BEG34]|uniref:Beta sliding clamp n=1 Tax=Candidatus Glomeribacter gigasporarum BEG34 TaxID=1070319 RepID=G2J9G4_9BURK|nr:DNA polymerase III subunit beta [Candidatus Glomeribacter gigasporarum]CCD29411.1 DNA polymerase III, beta subunit [Candidatus Glomeribacter gigasporarum BEG34]
MQWIKTERNQLIPPLQMVSGIVERCHTMPILAHVMITKNGSELAFLATDLDVQITARADIGSGPESAATTVAARKLLDILRAVPAGEVQISVADQRLTIQAGKSRFALQTLDAGDFPTVAQAQTFDLSVQITQKAFKALLGCTHFAMAQQDIRYYLHAMLLAVEGGVLSAVATDGHRLAFASTAVEGAFERREWIIPRRTVLELQRLLEESDAPVKMDVAPNQVKFSFAQVEFISKRIDARFPDFQRVIPQGYTRAFNIGHAAFQQALARAAILTSDKFKGVRCLIAPGQLKIISNNAENEEAQEELDIDYAGESADIGLNVSYLLDVLTHVKAETVRFSFADASASVLLTLTDNENFKYVVMPMRI